MNSLQRVSCLIVSIVAVAMFTNIMASDTNGFWVMLSEEARASSVSQNQVQSTAVNRTVAQPPIHVVRPRPVLGSAAWMARRMIHHARGQFHIQ